MVCCSFLERGNALTRAADACSDRTVPMALGLSPCSSLSGSVRCCGGRIAPAIPLRTVLKCYRRFSLVRLSLRVCQAASPPGFYLNRLLAAVSLLLPYECHMVSFAAGASTPRFPRSSRGSESLPASHTTRPEIFPNPLSDTWLSHRTVLLTGSAPVFIFAG